jgi:hypothetical protein
MSSTLTSWIGCAVALLLLLPHALTWRRTAALYGRINRTLIRQMLHLRRYTGHRRFLVLSFLQLGLLACIALVGVRVPLGIMAVVVAVALVPPLRVLLPPGVLFLAGSGDRATGLFFRLHLSAVSLRVVAGLDYRRMGLFGRMIRLDITRATNDKAWRSVVSRLIDIAPLIVIDTVGRTGPCRYEAGLVSTPERAARTVFICDEDGRCPSLEAVGIDPAEHAIPVICAENLEEKVHAVLRGSGPPPAGRTIPPPTPIIEENWDWLPSMLMIALMDGLDGRHLLALARNSDKDLIGLLTPHSSLDEVAAEPLIKLLWEFPRNPRLVGLFLQASGVTLVRRNFLLELLEQPELLDLHVEGIRPGLPSWEDLNRPEPITAAVYKLCIAWSREAKRHGLEFRFVQN